MVQQISSPHQIVFYLKASNKQTRVRVESPASSSVSLSPSSVSALFNVIYLQILIQYRWLRGINANSLTFLKLLIPNSKCLLVVGVEMYHWFDKCKCHVDIDGEMIIIRTILNRLFAYLHQSVFPSFCLFKPSLLVTTPWMCCVL